MSLENVSKSLHITQYSFRSHLYKEISLKYSLLDIIFYVIFIFQTWRIGGLTDIILHYHSVIIICKTIILKPDFKNSFWQFILPWETGLRDLISPVNTFIRRYLRYLFTCIPLYIPYVLYQISTCNDKVKPRMAKFVPA